MEKMKMKSRDVLKINLEQLKLLFPNFITESSGQNGETIESFDFDLFRQEFSDHLVEGQQERYQINWPGKRESLLLSITADPKSIILIMLSCAVFNNIILFNVKSL